MVYYTVLAAVAVALDIAALAAPACAQEVDLIDAYRAKYGIPEDEPLLPYEGEDIADIRARAEAGDALAQTRLGTMYATGRGVAQDDAEALRWFRLAADQDSATAQVYLGEHVRRGSRRAPARRRSGPLVASGSRSGQLLGTVQSRAYIRRRS